MGSRLLQKRLMNLSLSWSVLSFKKTSFSVFVMIGETSSSQSLCFGESFSPANRSKEAVISINRMRFIFFIFLISALLVSIN